MENSLNNSLEVAKQIADVAFDSYGAQGDKHQLSISIHPFISNAMYRAGLDILENERFKTLVTLARTLDDDNLTKAIQALKYTLSVKKK